MYDEIVSPGEFFSDCPRVFMNQFWIVNNLCNDQPSIAQRSIETARRSSNLSNEVASSSMIIDIDDDGIDHLPIQRNKSDSSPSFTFWEGMYRDSIRLRAINNREDVPASASEWAPPVNQLGNQSLLGQQQDSSSSHTNAAGTSGLPFQVQRLISDNCGPTSYPSQSLQAQQDLSSFQRNATGFPSLARNEGWNSLNNNHRLMSGNDGLASFPFQNNNRRGENFSRPDQLGNHWQPQKTEPLRQSIDFNKPYFSTGNLGIQQDRDSFQHSIDLNIPAISTARPFPAGLNNNFLTNDETCPRHQAPLASPQHIPVANVGQSSRANTGSSVKRKGTGPSLTNHTLVQRTKLTPFPSTQPPVLFANQIGASMASQPHVSLENRNAAASVASTRLPAAFANQNFTDVASARPLVSFKDQNAASRAAAPPPVSLTNQNAANQVAASRVSAPPPVSFANQIATRVASARPRVSFANQNSLRVASVRQAVPFANQNDTSVASARPPPVSLANHNAASTSARLPVSFANQVAASRVSAQPPVSFANQIATTVASARPHVTFANQNSMRLGSVRQAVPFTNQNDTNVASARRPISFANQNDARIVSAQTAVLLANHKATGVASARPPVSSANQNAARISSSQTTVSFANHNIARIASSQPSVSFSNPNPATAAQPPLPFVNPDAAVTRQRVRTRGPSTQQRVRTRGPSTQLGVRTRGPSQLQSSLPVPSTVLQNRMSVPTLQQQSWVHPSSTQLPSRRHPFLTQPQSKRREIVIPSTGPPEIAPIFHIKCEVDLSCRPTGKMNADCELCHKDLSEQPDGVASSEHAHAPMSAFLPCGHVFHDHCLAIITPPEQSQSPPCIPCSLGDHHKS